MSRHHPIPDAALDDRLGYIGTSGSGKTYNAGGAVERLLRKRARVVIVDPLGVWWGLRLLADGKRQSPYNVAIFGGPRGDLPLTEHAGALIGETAATMAESCIVDLSELGSKAADRRFMTAFLDTLYRKASGEPFHLVVDEADLFAPQKPAGGDETLLGLMEQIVRRGRVKGFIPWLISQRPAVLNKNVLSQVDGLIAFKLTASQDRDALDAWIEGQADKAQGRAIKDALPAMQVGEGVVWLPGRGLLATVNFPAKETFDSSRTPKRGEKRKRTAALKPLDLGALNDRLTTVEQEAKQNDPKKLRAEIAALKKEKADLERKRSTAPAADPDALKAAEQRGFERGLKQGERNATVRPLEDLAEACERFGARLKPLADKIEVAHLEALGALKVIRQPLIEATPPRPAPAPLTYKSTPRPAPMPRPAVLVDAPGGDGTITGPLQKIIDAIHWWNAFGIIEPNHPQVGFIAGYAHKSGTWNRYLSNLRSMGLIEPRGPLVLTGEGRAAANEPIEPPSGEALRASILSKIDGPLGRILTPLITVYPDGLSHEQAAEASNYVAGSGTWNRYLSRLRSLDLIGKGGALRAQDWLFP